MSTSPDMENFRTTRNWTRAQLAEALGVDTSTVWRWENGKRMSRPVIIALEKLAAEHPPVNSEKSGAAA